MIIKPCKTNIIFVKYVVLISDLSTASLEVEQSRKFKGESDCIRYQHPFSSFKRYKDKQGLSGTWRESS